MSFSICPIGGLGQIGSNMMEVKSTASSFIIDCGILFPYEDTFNINYLIPNFEDLERPEFIIITHGHEDHIGALGHLVEKFPGITIYAPPFARELIRKKFEFYPRKLSFKLKTQLDEAIEIDHLNIDYIQVNHSIPDTFGIFITNTKTKTGLLYISDFKVDLKAKLEPVFDFKKLEKLSRNLKKRILMPDSTNITSSMTKTPSEEDLVPQIQAYLNSTNNRVFITTFSSNVHRIQNILECSKASGRKCVLYGRSMKNYWETAYNAGIVDSLYDFHDVSEVDTENDKLTVIVSGCQGDFRSTFRRISMGQDSWFKPSENDLFLLSSKSIPGNEKKIGLCLNELSREGVTIVTANDDLIHASGHACKEDLTYVLNSYKPDVIIPIHGESFFLERHQKWLKQVAPQASAFKIFNYQEFDLENNLVSLRAEKAPILIQGLAHILDRQAISERRKIAEAGLVVITIVHNKSKILDKQLHFEGITFQEELPFEKFEKNIFQIIQKEFKPAKANTEQVRVNSRRLFIDLLGIKPVVRVNTCTLK
jgi:ribonuclease J